MFHNLYYLFWTDSMIKQSDIFAASIFTSMTHKFENINNTIKSYQLH